MSSRLDSAVREIVDILCREAKEILKDNFVGFYVHGSAVMSGYNPLKSDCDYIIVCKNEPGNDEKKALLYSAENHWDIAPAKGYEMHVLCLDDCRNPAYEPRFVLHYSAMHRNSFRDNPENYIGYMKGNDADLNAHFTVMRARGYVYDGDPISEAFGEVPRRRYLEAILEDAEWNEEEAMYHVLNSARTLAYIHEGRICSKLEGGEWALEKMPEYSKILQEAITACKSDEVMKPSQMAQEFCAYAKDELQKALVEQIKKDEHL